jgi:hypothetical protein
MGVGGVMTPLESREVGYHSRPTGLARPLWIYRVAVPSKALPSVARGRRSVERSVDLSTVMLLESRERSGIPRPTGQACSPWTCWGAVPSKAEQAIVYRASTVQARATIACSPSVARGRR